MPESADYQVLEALKTALSGITTANGYQTDVQLVDLYERFHDDIAVFPAISIGEMDTTEDQTQFSDYNVVRMRVGMVLMLETYVDEHSAVGQFVADVKDRLFSEVPAYLGGLSKWIRVESVDRVHATEEDPRCGAVVIIQLLFRHPLQDAYTLIP
jgi:hypothetical protein